MIPQLLIHSDKDLQIKAAEQQLATLNLKRLHPDVLWMEPDKEGSSLGVKNAKIIREHFSLKPFQAAGRVGVIISAESLTIDAQNSLLKTLEELPASSQLILTADSDSTFLPTILSRCLILRIDQTDKTSAVDSKRSEKLKSAIDKLSQLSLEERFKLVEQTEDKEGLLQALISVYSQKIRRQPHLFIFAKQLLQAEEYHQANVNIRTILEYLMLVLPLEQLTSGENKKAADNTKGD